MEVILLENIGRLGNLGDKVSVKRGYGRNYLIPYGKAVFASEKSLAEFESRRAELEKAAAESKILADARAEALEGKEFTFVAKAGEEGKLFGSVGTRDIAELITVAGTEVSKSEVKLPEGAIRQTGEYEISLQFHSEVMVSVKLLVQPE